MLSSMVEKLDALQPKAGKSWLGKFPAQPRREANCTTSRNSREKPAQEHCHQGLWIETLRLLIASPKLGNIWASHLTAGFPYNTNLLGYSRTELKLLSGLPWPVKDLQGPGNRGTGQVLNCHMDGTLQKILSCIHAACAEGNK